MSTIDLLLLNATNVPWRPIFPYAFVQVGALARRAGLRVRAIDLLRVPRVHWASFLADVIAEAHPRMVGLHVRQVDSVFVDDYQNTPPRPYFPVDDSRALVEILRGVTRAPIAAGGFGFTTHAHRLYSHLGVDVGIAGDPDDFIARFDDVVAGRGLEQIAGLIHAGGANARGYYAPLPEREYTDHTVDALAQFYGRDVLFGADPPTVAVELMRGCVFRCYFCTEPFVKGAQLRHRDLDVVEAELDFLAWRGVRRFWLICSELDMQGTKLALALAERIVRLREKHGVPLEWSAYSLPRLREDELRVLQRAGYAGALNDVLSLDDANLRAARVPYRSRQAVAFLKAVTALDREDAAASRAAAATAEGKVAAGLVQRQPKELASVIGLFLGNAHVTPATIPTTLRRVEAEGLRDNYRMGLAFPATRVFEPAGAPICATTPRGLRIYNGADPAVAPAFYFPDFLVEKLGSIEAVVALMKYIGATLLSNAHRARIGAGVAAQLEPIFAAHPADVARVEAALDLPPPPRSTYALLAHLAARFASRDALIAAVGATPGTVARLYVEWLLYANNVVLSPAYREILFGVDSNG